MLSKIQILVYISEELEYEEFLRRQKGTFKKTIQSFPRSLQRKERKKKGREEKKKRGRERGRYSVCCRLFADYTPFLMLSGL